MGDKEGGARGPRCVALVGPFQSGKTTLLEAILARTGAVQRQGTVDAGTSVGDASKEARHHKMSVEVTVATTDFMGDSYTFLDCPGSVEFVHDMRAVLPSVDAAVVVCEADERKVSQLQLILRELEEQKIPRFIFLNKVDKADKQVRESLKLLQPASRVPLLLRQIPIWNNEIVTGFVDLALERAYVYKEHAPSEVVKIDDTDHKDARFSMLETLADHDDELMEQLLADIPPPRDRVFDDLAKELRDGLVCPVLIGVATRTNGVLRLLKALRHESPGVASTAKRLGVKAGGDAVVTVLKTFHTTHGGKLSVARVLNGPGRRRRGPSPRWSRRRAVISGVFKMLGQSNEKRGPASAGETVALGKLDHAHTGDTLSSGKTPHPAVHARGQALPIRACSPSRSPPRSARTTSSSGWRSTSLSTRTPRSPSTTIPRPTRSWCGARARCTCGSRPSVSLPIASASPSSRRRFSERRLARSTIKKPIQQRGRHKKQSGGHGQFGDVVLDIKPLPRNAGFAFEDEITGGVVPRNYIPSVEEGVIDALAMDR